MRGFSEARCLGMLMLLLSLAGCRDAAAPERNPASDSLKIGVIGILGRDTSTRDFAGGAQLAAKEINGAGGVNGQPIEILVNADLPGALNGPLGAQSLVQEGCIGLIGPAFSSMALETYSQVCVPTGAPLISYAATSPALTSLPGAGDLVWRTVPSDAFQGVILATMARSLGLTRVSILYRNDTYGSSLAAVFAARFQAAGGTVQASVGYSPDATQFSTEVAQALAGGVPQGIFTAASELEAAGLLRQLQIVNPLPKPVFLGADGMYGPSFLANAPMAYADGMYGTTNDSPVGDPSYDRFAADFLARMGEDPTPGAEGAYDAVYLMALAMTRAKANTSQALRTNLRIVSGGLGVPSTKVGPLDFHEAVEVLRAGHEVDFDGASGMVDWDAHGDVTSATYLWWRLSGSDFITLQKIRVP